MKNFNKLMALVFVIAMVTAVTAMAGPGKCKGDCRGDGPKAGMGGGHERGMQMMVRNLDLNPEQAEQIEKIKNRSRNAMQDIREEQREAQRRLVKAVKAGDEDEVNEIAEQIADAIVKKTTTMVRTDAAILEVLTPEQAEKYNDFKKKMRNHRSGKGKGHGKGMKPRRDGSMGEGPRGDRDWSRDRCDRPDGPRGGRGMNPERLDNMFRDADTNGDGVLTRQEIGEFLEARCPAPRGGRPE